MNQPICAVRSDETGKALISDANVMLSALAKLPASARKYLLGYAAACADMPLTDIVRRESTG